MSSEKPATVKPELTVDVVDAVWVEDRNGRLHGFGHWNAMHAIYGYEIREGTARIVRIRSEIEDDRVRSWAREADKRLVAAIGRIEDLESRLAALAAAPKPAARVVKAPGRPVYGDGDWRKGVEWEAKRWRAALAEAGITIADDNPTQH